MAPFGPGSPLSPGSPLRPVNVRTLQISLATRREKFYISNQIDQYLLLLLLLIMVFPNKSSNGPYNNLALKRQFTLECCEVLLSNNTFPLA